MANMNYHSENYFVAQLIFNYLSSCLLSFAVERIIHFFLKKNVSEQTHTLCVNEWKPKNWTLNLGKDTKMGVLRKQEFLLKIF